MLRSEGLKLNGTKTVVTILSLINILDDGRGVYCARIVRHTPEYAGDYIYHWDLVDDGPMFEIISERDTCCQCKLFFNTLVILLIICEIIMKDKKPLESYP